MGKDDTCLGCSKKFNKSEACVRCNICGLWSHKQCAGLTDDLFKMMEMQIKVTGSSCWSCKPCTSYALGITQRMKEIEGKLENVEKKMEDSNKVVKGLKKKVEKVEEEIKKKDAKVEQAVKESEYRMCEEMKEREARKKNIILHDVGEDRNVKSSGKERQEWDRRSCYNIFTAMEIVMDEGAVRFCRRVGERKEGPRPLVCGFWEEADRNRVIRNTRKLEGTDFSNVSVGPDLTKRQREEEAVMRKEADRRNEEDLTEEDKQKNLRWTAVGDRGQKFLIKTVARDSRSGAWGTENRFRKDTGAIPRRGRGGGGMRGMVTGGRYERRTRSTADSAREREEERDREKEKEKEKEVSGEGEEEEAEKETTEQEEESDLESEEGMDTEVESEPEAVKKGKRKAKSPGGAPPEKR